MSEMNERVQRGARWLDQHNPDWLERVDVKALSMSDCFRCVLGQLYGLYHAGLKAAGFPPSQYLQEGSDWAQAHGFCLSPFQGACFLGYEHLTTAWRKLIAARRAHKEQAHD